MKGAVFVSLLIVLSISELHAIPLTKQPMKSNWVAKQLKRAQRMIKNAFKGSLGAEDNVPLSDFSDAQ